MAADLSCKSYMDTDEKPGKKEACFAEDSENLHGALENLCIDMNVGSGVVKKVPALVRNYYSYLLLLNLIKELTA